MYFLIISSAVLDKSAPISIFFSLSHLCTAEALFKKLLLIIEQIGDPALHPFYIATSYVILVT